MSGASVAKSWLSIPEDSDFSLENLPFGVFSSSSSSPRRRCATILGDTVVDLSVLEEAGLLEDIPGLAANVFNQPVLNAFIKHERPVWIAVRQRLLDLFSDKNNDNASVDTFGLRTNAQLQKAAFFPVSAVTLHLPIDIGDYTDFYSSREHATNCGSMFRDKATALQPNWLHLPVGYHGRASTVVCSGQDICRPMGQLQKNNADPNQGSIHGPSQRLDFELEVAAVVGGPPNQLGQALTIQQAKERIFGFLLMNDWSARDIQKWEYVPLGPFTAKNFATTVSPWIITALALEHFVASTSTGPQQTDPEPLNYLKDPEYSSYDVELTVSIQTKNQSQANIVSRSNFRNMYWNSAQQLVHHAVSGCVMKAGDLLGSGTISGQTNESYGSMLELSWNGTKEVVVGDEVRQFLEDGDTVILNGFSQKAGHGRVGFGECRGTILPSLTVDTAVSGRGDVGELYTDFKLYGYWRSSSTWRVRTALAASGIKYETIVVNLEKMEHKQDEFLAKSPLGQVPLLEYTDTVTKEVVRLSQSVAIIEFLDSAFPTRRSLLPKDPHYRALAMEMTEVINSGTQPLQNVYFLRELEEKSEGKIVATEHAKLAIERGLHSLESLVKRRAEKAHGPFCLGTFSPTIVDAFMVPQLYNARRFQVNVDQQFPVLAEIDARCAEHAWFKVSHPSAQPDAP